MSPHRAWPVVVLVVALVAPACSNGSNGSGGGGSSGETCPGGFDAGSGFGVSSVNELDQCGSDLLSGTKQNGEACTSSTDCASVCCACPNAGRSANVAWCDNGQCVVGADACCAFIAQGMSESDGGVPFVCAH
jgi:hypothetical protein